MVLRRQGRLALEVLGRRRNRHSYRYVITGRFAVLRIEHAFGYAFDDGLRSSHSSLRSGETASQICRDDGCKAIIFRGKIANCRDGAFVMARQNVALLDRSRVALQRWREALD